MNYPKHKLTCRSRFRRDFAKARHGVVGCLHEFICVWYRSSAVRAASSKKELRGKTVRQSSIALRRNFIILVLLDVSSLLLKRDSKSRTSGWLLLCARVSFTLTNSSIKESGKVSSLESFSVQLALFVQNLHTEETEDCHPLYLVW